MGYFDDKVETARVNFEIEKPRTYKLILGQFRTRDALQHEMWHVYEVENDITNYGSLSYMFNPFYSVACEWRATTYALEEPNE